MNETFEMLDNLCFPTDGDGAIELAYIGSNGTPYIRICKTDNVWQHSLKPTFSIIAASVRAAGRAITDRFVQEYATADEAGRNRQAPIVLIGIGAVLLRHIKFDNELGEWLTLSQSNTNVIFERYFENVIKGRTLTDEQIAKLGAKHISAEQAYLSQSQRQWAELLSDHPEPLEKVSHIVEEYITFVKDKTKPSQLPAMDDLLTFFKPGHGCKATEMLNKIGGKSGKQAAEIVWEFQDFLLDENGILNRIFEPLSKIKEWNQSKQSNWYKQVQTLMEKEEKRQRIEKKKFPNK